VKKPIKILKKLTGLVSIYKPKTEKTKPNRTQTEKNPSQTGKTELNRKNRAKPVFVLKNQTESKPVGLNRFRFFLKKNSVWLFFF
jgi:hypothetical protein